jgi:hypothetical protein
MMMKMEEMMMKNQSLNLNQERVVAETMMVPPN